MFMDSDQQEEKEKINHKNIEKFQPSTQTTEIQTMDDIDPKTFIPKESINTVDFERGFYRDEGISVIDDEEKKVSDELMNIMYSVCVNYSEDLIMSQRMMRPGRDQRQRNIFDKFTLSNILDSESLRI